MSDVKKLLCPVRRYQAYIEFQIAEANQKRAPPEMISQAKDKLKSEGWTLWKKRKKTKQGERDEQRYCSPGRTNYGSLNMACKQYIECQDSGLKGATEDCLSSACVEDGPFMMCSDCQSSFHTKCVGLQAIPEGNWFCASCSCFCCGEYYQCTDQSSDTKVSCCHQCKVKYHERCLKYPMHQKLCPNGTKVCSLKCYKVLYQIHFGLQQSSKRRVKNDEIVDYPLLRIKIDRPGSDSLCSVCMNGGSLMRCSDCPSQFHSERVGLKAMPEANWFCASCYCVKCGSREYFPSLNQFTPKTVLCCDQCEGKYHLGCMQKMDLNFEKKGTWFCSKECSKMFWKLRGLVGVSNSTSVEGLCWTILRWSGQDESGLQRFDNKTRSKHRTKLLIAKDLFSESFDSLVEVHDEPALISSLLFSREFVVDRLNFWGFYIMLLEDKEKIISVAAFRVFGEKIAEMPFIVTRRGDHLKGMCRLLVNELSKLLSDLGVERLLLPANSEVENMWTTKFNFSRMTSSDLLGLSRYTLVNFAGAIRLQKGLRVPTTSEE